jgi:hypothetical protein
MTPLQRGLALPTTATAAFPALRQLERLRREVRGLTLAILAWTSALGLLSVAVAYDRARRGGEDEVLFWLGLLVIFVPIAWRLAGGAASRRERIALVVLLGLALYAVKVLQSPVDFTLHDEFSHIRTLDDIQRSGRLFLENPLLPASPFYPGLELATAVLMKVTGFGAFAAGILVIGAARVVQVVAVFLLFDAMTSRPRLAGIGTLVYIVNPGFLFFDAAFSYESLALPVATAVLWFVLRARDSEGRGPWLIAAVGGIAAVAITHHVTTIFLMTLLTAWAILERRAGRRGRPGPVVVAAVTSAVLNAAWLGTVGRPVLDYLIGVFGGAVGGAIESAMAGSARQLFARTPGAPSVPVWEPLVAYGTVGLLLLLLPFGILAIWRRQRHEPLALVLIGLALVYPISLALRFTGAGVEASQRASEFVFLGIGFAVATLVSALEQRPFLVRGHLPTSALAPVVTAAATFCFVGGVVVGVSPYLRLPADYRVGADARSIDDQGLAAADWTRTYLGPDREVVADSANRRIQAALGGQDPVTAYNDGIGTAWLMFSSTLSDTDRRVLREARIEYVIADYRLTLALPEFGIYFEPAEPDAFAHETPMSPEAIFKWDREPDVARLYDSGDIVIYDVRELSHAR